MSSRGLTRLVARGKFDGMSLTKKKTETKPRIGRPSTYTSEKADEICMRLASGQSLHEICRDKERGMPNIATIYDWLDAHPSFSERYARARLSAADTLADEIQSLSDEEPRMVIGADGTSRIDTGWVQWHRLRVDSRKWIASKLKPRAYAEKLHNEITGKDGGAIEIDVVDASALSPEARDALRDILMSASAKERGDAE